MITEVEINDCLCQSDDRERGFSMIEMLIAIVVITFGLASIVGISIYVSRSNSISATLNVLAAAAQDQVDRLRTARWTPTFTDPMLEIGGAVPAVASANPMEPVRINWNRSYAGTFLLAAATPTATQTPIGGTYQYLLDPENPHRARASGTPAGDLNINWQVRQGGTPNVRFVTINVAQVMAAPNLANGLTVTTIIVRN